MSQESMWQLLVQSLFNVKIQKINNKNNSHKDEEHVPIVDFNIYKHLQNQPTLSAPLN